MQLQKEKKMKAAKVVLVSFEAWWFNKTIL